MGNLFRFIIKHHFVFLFVLIELFSLILVVRYNNPHRSKFINSTNLLVGSVRESIDAVSQYFNLTEVNETLAAENASLRRKLHSSKFKLLVEGVTVNDTTYGQRYQYLPAKVINNSVNRQKNYLTINIGTRHGVEKDMAVISSNGIVGIVSDVSNNFSTVISVLNRGFKVSAELANNHYFGSVYWNGRDPGKVQLADIPYHVEVQTGQSVITNSFSNIYPAGIKIGVIDTFSVDRHRNFYDIQIDLSTDMRNVEYVYVVKDLLKKERAGLERRIKR